MSNIKVQKSNGNETYEIQKMYAYYAENSETIGRKTASQLKTDIIDSSLFIQDKIVDEDFNINYTRSDGFDNNVLLPQNYNFFNTVTLRWMLEIRSATVRSYKSDEFAYLTFGFRGDSKTTNSYIYSPNNSTPVNVANKAFFDNLFVRFFYSMRESDNSTFQMLLQDVASVDIDISTGFILSQRGFFGRYNSLTTSNITGHLSLWAIKINL